jgi:hypothetical protein
VDIPGEEQWVTVARNVLSGEEKYFVSDAPEDTPLGTLLTSPATNTRTAATPRPSENALKRSGIDIRKAKRCTETL